MINYINLADICMDKQVYEEANICIRKYMDKRI